LVQLQADLDKLKAANIQIVAISTDSVDVLSDFSKSKRHRLRSPFRSGQQDDSILWNPEHANSAGLPNPETF